MKKAMSVLVSLGLAMQAAGCGTIMHPERKGQKGGRIDAGVAILDALGLLFFIIPGVIAFAVDFSNGTIYLPGGPLSSVEKQFKVVKFDPKHATDAEIEQLIWKETGKRVHLRDGNVQVTKLKSIEALRERFAELKLSGGRT